MDCLEDLVELSLVQLLVVLLEELLLLLRMDKVNMTIRFVELGEHKVIIY